MPNVNALTFEEFRKKVMDDYRTAFASYLFWPVVREPEFIRESDYEIFEPGNVLVMLAQKTVMIPSDFTPDSPVPARLLSTLCNFRAFNKELPEDLKEDLAVEGKEVAFINLQNKDYSTRQFINLYKTALLKKLPIVFSVMEDKENLIAEDNRISRHYVERILGELPHDIHKFEGFSADYIDLCKQFASGVSICRDLSEPVFFRIKFSPAYEDADPAVALADFRKWILDMKISDTVSLLSEETAIREDADSLKKKIARRYLKMATRLI